MTSAMKNQDIELTNGNTNGGFQPDNGGTNGTVAVGMGPTSGTSMTEKEIKRAKMNIIKNLVAVSFGFLLLFTAFQSISNLQSSINSIDGLGTASLSVIYAALIVSCMFVPSYMIARLGCKYTLVIAMLMYTSYMVANFYAHWYTLIPTAAILGLGGAPLWSAKCTYLTEIASQYANLVGELPEVYVNKFFGVFFMMFQTAQIWGNLISAYVLRPQNKTYVDVSNHPEILNQCGINFCEPTKKSDENETNVNLDRPSDIKIYTLSGIYVGCALLAALFVFIVLDQLQRKGQEKEGVKNGTEKPSMKLFIATFKHMRNPYQLLIAPLTIYSGVEQAFIASDFTRAYISCAWGIHNIGMVMIVFGISDALTSLALGPLVKLFGRIPMFIFGAITHAMMVMTLFLWTPNPDDTALFFVIGGLWGVGDAVWQTQINSLYGVLFAKEEEAAFSNYRLWESLGFILAFAYNTYLCVRIKLYVLIAFLIAGMLGYAVIEVLQVRKSKRESKSN